MNREFTYLGSKGKLVAPNKKLREPIPGNHPVALRCAKSLDASLHKDEKTKQHFLSFMQKIYDNYCTELAPHFPPDKKRCDHPLFGVYHPYKLDHIRGVLDSSTIYEGVSLNDQQMQGPDLLGVPMRFRKKMIAVASDIQHMFHCFLVHENHKDYLRFLWHEYNILENLLVTYRMRAHVDLRHQFDVWNSTHS
jgi:hypothetical protein